MSDEKPKDPISEAVEAVRKEAYAEGYRAGLTAAANALADLAEGAPVAAPSHVSAKADGAPTVGTTPYCVWQAVLKKPGMTNSELISVVHGELPKTTTGSIRTSINRVRHKRLIVARHGKWFPQGA
jgi:hypothetical protein